MSEDTFRMGADFEPQEAVVVGWPRLIEPVKGVFAEGTVHEIVRNLIGHVDKIIINCGWPGSAARKSAEGHARVSASTPATRSNRGLQPPQ